jgi:hypothetical protein
MLKSVELALVSPVTVTESIRGGSGVGGFAATAGDNAVVAKRMPPSRRPSFEAA